MVAGRVGWLAGALALLAAVPARGAEGDVPSVAASPEPPRPPVVLGLLADAGVPDGATAALVLRATPWLRFSAGGGTNTISAGFRGGLTLQLPTAVAPSFSLEVGSYRAGDANGLVRTFTGGDGTLRPLFESVGYAYVNTQLGLEVGRGTVRFYVHAGLSYLHATLHDTNVALATGAQESVTVTLRQDPVLRVWAPSAKAGLIVYLGDQ